MRAPPTLADDLRPGAFSREGIPHGQAEPTPRRGPYGVRGRRGPPSLGDEVLLQPQRGGTDDLAVAGVGRQPRGPDRAPVGPGSGDRGPPASFPLQVSARAPP